MSASVFSHNGRASAVPRVSVKTDASALNATNPASTNAIAVLGSGVGPAPASASLEVDDLTLIRSPAEARARIRSGDLLEMILKMFSPSTSTVATGRPEYIVALPVNQSVRGSANLTNSIGAAQTIQSVAYGEFTNQIAISVADGTVAGKRYTVVADGITYTADNLGVVDDSNTGFETSVVGFRYNVVAPQNGYSVMTVDKLTSGAIRFTGYETLIGGGRAVSPLLLPTTDLPDTLTIVSSSGSDNMQAVVMATVGGVPTKLEATLNGTTPVPLRDAGGGIPTVTALHGIWLAGGATGTISVATSTTLTTIGEVAVAATGNAYEAYTRARVANAPVYLFNATGTASGLVVVEGLNSAGTRVYEIVNLAIGVQVKTTTNWSQIDAIWSGGIANTETIRLQAVAVQTGASHDTMQKVVDYVNADLLNGITATLYSGFTSMDPQELDSVTTTIPIQAALGHLTAIEYATRTWVNSTGIVTADRAAYTSQISTITITTGESGNWTVQLSGGGITTTAQSFTGTAVTTETASALLAAIQNMTIGHQRMFDVGATIDGSVVTLTVSRQVLSAPMTITITPPTATGVAVVAMTVPQAGSHQVPANIALTLSNGADGSTLDWTNAFRVLTGTTVNSIVVLSGEPSVHSALKTHLQSREDQSNACDGFVGLSALDGGGAATGALPARSSIKTQIRNLNYPKIRVCAERVSWYDSTGTLTTFAPWFQAGLAAALQAAVPVAEPLTRKLLDVIAVTRDSSWSPSTHDDEMVRAGLWFVRDTSRGKEVVRNVTSWIGSTNIALNEGSCQHVANLIARDVYALVDPSVGSMNTDALIAAVQGRLQARSRLWQDLGWITAFQEPEVRRVGDRVTAALSVSVTQPANFFEINVFLT